MAVFKVAMVYEDGRIADAVRPEAKSVRRLLFTLENVNPRNRRD